MNAVGLTGNDTLTLNNTVLTDFADGNCVELSFPNDIAQVKTGKNGNSIYAQNQTGNNGELKLRLIRGSSDDNFMNNLLIQQQNNFSGTVLLQGQFVKVIGNGLGTNSFDTYILSGGVFMKIQEAKENVEGDTEQSVTMYTIKFATVVRVLT
jgi:hypothetical protein